MLQPFRAPAIDSKDQRGAFGLPRSQATTVMYKLGSVLSISKQGTSGATGANSAAPQRLQQNALLCSLLRTRDCQLGLSLRGTFELLNGLKTRIWNPSFVQHHWKTRWWGSSRSLKHILASSLNIHVQSPGLGSSTSSPMGTSGNLSYLSLCLLGTGI